MKSLIAVLTILLSLSVSARKLDSMILLDDSIATDTSEVIRPNSHILSFMTFGTTSTGAGSATVLIEASLDNTNWFTVDTLSLTLATTVSNDDGNSVVPYPYIRARISAISGTDATVSVYLASSPVR